MEGSPPGSSSEATSLCADDLAAFPAAAAALGLAGPQLPSVPESAAALTAHVATGGPMRAYGACPAGSFGTNPCQVWECRLFHPVSGPTTTDEASQAGVVGDRVEWGKRPSWVHIYGSGCSSPVMSAAESALLVRTYAGAVRIFESGSGGSTRIAASLPTLRTLVSVDSDPEWAVRSNLTGLLGPDVEAAMIFVDIDAPFNDWGRPGPRATEAAMRSYSAQLLLHPRGDFDVVLVDGRFRVACALAFALKGLPSTSRLVVHDYSVRPHYHVIEKYLEKVEEAEGTAVFRARPPAAAAGKGGGDAAAAAAQQGRFMEEVRAAYEQYALVQQ